MTLEQDQARARARARAKAKAGAEAPAGEEPSIMQKVADYVKGSAENLADPQWKDALWRGSHDSQGRNIGEQLSNPRDAMWAIGDQAAIASDDLSFGLYPRAVDAVTGTTDQTDRVKQARALAGSAGTGMDAATMMAIPSNTARAAVGPVSKALGFGAEGAAMSSVRPLLEGADQREVLAAMLKGGLTSAAGSAVGSMLPFGKVKAIPRRGPYPDDKSLFKDSSRTPRTTIEGKDLASRTEKVKDLRLAATKGQPGLKELDKKQIDANTVAKGYKLREPHPYEERLKISEAAHGTPPSGVLGGISRVGGNILKAGGLPLSWMTGGKSAILSAGAEEATRAAMSRSGRKQIDEIADYIRNQGLGQMPTSISPELANQLRDYVAKSMRGSGDKKQYVDPETIDSWKK